MEPFNILGVKGCWKRQCALLMLTCCSCAQMLIKRGLYATALENAKLLLGFNLADPTGILMCIDYIAIKAGLYNFVKVRSCFTSPSGRTGVNVC